MMFLIMANVASVPTASQGVEDAYFQNANGCSILYNIKTGDFEVILDFCTHFLVHSIPDAVLRSVQNLGLRD